MPEPLPLLAIPLYWPVRGTARTTETDQAIRGHVSSGIQGAAKAEPGVRVMALDLPAIRDSGIDYGSTRNRCTKYRWLENW